MSSLSLVSSAYILIENEVLEGGADKRGDNTAIGY